MAASMAYHYGNITANTTITLKSGLGVLHGITINAPGTSWVATVYDSLTGSGTKIGTLALTTDLSPYLYDVEFVNGLTIVTSGTTPGDLTVAFGG